MQKGIPLLKNDNYALLKLTNGEKRKVDISYGSSFLSQSARFLSCGKNVLSAEVVNTQGKHRMIDLK